MAKKQTFFGPNAKEWSESASYAHHMGFNFLRDFQPMIWEIYPESREYSFGKFSESDISNQQTIGWKFLTGSMFDVENFDKIVGSRFGLRLDVHNRVMYGDEYVMLMSKKHRNEVILPARKALHQRMEARADDDAVVVHPEDPEFNKMKDAGRELARTEKYKVQGRGEPDHGEDMKGKGASDNW